MILHFTPLNSVDNFFFLTGQELCDDDDEMDVDKEGTTSAFKPEHTSTQKLGNDPDATGSFAPYTLPTLNTVEPEEEEEEKTQPFQGDRPEDDLLSEVDNAKKVKKEEKVDQIQEEDLKFNDEIWKEEEEDSRRKRVRNEESSPQHQEHKKAKIIVNHNENKLIGESQEQHNGGSNKRKLPESDESIFTLPPRARQREVSTQRHRGRIKR